MSTQTLTKESQTKNKSLNISKGQTTATKKPPSSGNPQVPTREATSATSATTKETTRAPNTNSSVLEQWIGLSREQLDTIYKQAKPGSLPQGDTYGTAILAGGPLPKLFAKAANLLAWQGKVFDLFAPNFNSGVVVNKVSPLGVNLIVAKVYRGESWMDGKDTIIIDYSSTSLFAQKIRDEIREIEPGLYLGKVWLGKTRILDFALETH